jgi:cytochrome c oxidase subunit 3
MDESAMPVLLAEQVAIRRPDDARTGGPNGGGPRDLWPRGRGGDGDGDGHEHEGRHASGLGLLGMQLLLISVTVLFATIALVYYQRAGARANWRPLAPPSLLWLSTTLILASSWTLEAARRAFYRRRVDPYGNWLLITFMLGAGFLISQLLSLRQLLVNGAYLRGNAHSSLFFVITGAHGLHLGGGLLALFYLVVRAALRPAPNSVNFSRQQILLGVTTLYWHFLDVLWLALFAMLLLW